MPQRKTTVERAMELARSGSCRNVDDVRRALTREHHDAVLSHLSSPSLKRQLQQMIRTAATVG